MSIVRIPLNGVWFFKGLNFNEYVDVSRIDLSAEGWMRGEVPGVVHLDLMRNGVIPDPFYRMNEIEVSWIEEKDWLYVKEFEASSEIAGKSGLELIFQGLDTYAEVWLNGVKLCEADNMFHPWRFKVNGLIKPGKNTLLVRFKSPSKVMETLESKYGRLWAAFYNARVYGRKAQYSFGWDWGPRLPTVGIWKSVELLAYDEARLGYVSALPMKVSDEEALVKVEAEVYCVKPCRVKLLFRLEGEDVEASVEGLAGEGLNVFSSELKIGKPKLWYPRGYGAQHLYTLNTTLLSGMNVLDSLKVRFGVRCIELQRSSDEEGECFIFRINGIPVFCKGANWIPADSLLPRVNREVYRRLLEAASEANMNMLRVWGGGIYENDDFYDLCDELGIMVWQDFMFACGEYPEEDFFIASVEREVEENVKRLRSHPSIVLWCGNNENDWGFKAKWWVRDKFYGEKIYHKVIPEIVKRLDPTRPYWPSSPYGGEDPNSPREGDRHSWDIWSGWRDWRFYLWDNGRFISEFGFQAPPVMETVESFTAEEDRWAQSQVMEWHNKMYEGTERLYRFLAAHFRVPEDLRKFIYLTQLNQAEALKTAISHWRSRMFKTSGCLIWQINDCWPVVSWSLIDYYFRPKPAYYYVKRAFNSVYVALNLRGRSLQISVVNDTLQRIKGVLKLTVQKLTGELLLSKTIENLDIEGNSAKECLVLDVESFKGAVAVAEFTFDGGKAVNDVLIGEFKHVELPDPMLNIRVEKLDMRRFKVSLTVKNYAYGVYIKLRNVDAKYNDNYLSIPPNSEAEILVETPRDLTIEEFKSILEYGFLKW
ncbi:MAG: glycoside hydrolase family 2 TIM barrel-domain containing protein [Candidatus Bathyarchaeia archaeon]